MRISDWSQTCALPISGAGPVAQAQSAPTIGQPLEAGVLDALRGGESVAVVSVKDDGEVSGNHAANITSGPNAIDGRAFANAAGVNTEIGRASCRESVCPYVSLSVVAVPVKHTHQPTTICREHISSYYHHKQHTPQHRVNRQ